MNPLLTQMLGESASVEIQASDFTASNTIKLIGDRGYVPVRGFGAKCPKNGAFKGHGVRRIPFRGNPG
jgi:hypothetical protein